MLGVEFICCEVEQAAREAAVPALPSDPRWVPSPSSVPSSPSSSSSSSSSSSVKVQGENYI